MNTQETIKETDKKTDARQWLKNGWLAVLCIMIMNIASFTSLPLIAQEQSTGSLRGKVHDATTKEPLIGASVILVGTSFGNAADLNGEVFIKNIPAGTYRIQASFIGYKSIIITDVVVAAGRQNQLEFDLPPTEVSLKTVVVEADYFQKNTDMSVSSQKLSYEEIRRAPGGLEDVIRAVSVLPGVVQASAGRNDLIVRGGAPSENLYVVDNLEIPNINHFGTQGATGGPLSFVNLDFVRDVTFSTGGFGARYGDKLSSVMSIDLKDGRRDRLGGKVTVAATQFGLNAEGPLGNDGSVLFSARRSYLDFIFKAANFGFVPEYWDFLGKATYKLGRSDELSFLGIGALDNVRFFNNTADQRYSNSRILGNAQNQYFSNFTWKHLMSSGYMTVSLGRTFVQYEFIQSDSLLRPLFNSNSREGETCLRADAVLLPMHELELTFGAQAKYGRIFGDYLFNNAGGSQSLPFSAARNWDTTTLKLSAYAQASTTLGSAVRLTVGGRLDHFNWSENPTVIAPRAAIAWEAAPLTTVTLSVGVYYQSPASVWLINNELKFLRVNQGVLGVEHILRSDTKVRIEGYVKQYADYPASLARPYLVLANTGAGFGGSEDGFAAFGFEPLSSGGSGISRGVELLVQKRLSEIPCYGLLSLSYGQTEYTAVDGVARAGLYDQRLIFNLSGGYKFNERWEVSMKFRLGTGTPYTPYNSDGTQSFTADYNTARFPVFHSLDLRVDRRWNFGSWNLITYIDVENVYNQKNIQAYRWDTRTQEVVSNAGNIGILPTIGVSAEF